MPLQSKHLFSVKEYYRMAEAGVLKPDARVELLDGEIIDMSPIGPFHGGVVTYLHDLLALEARGRWLVISQNPVRLDDHSEPQPDLLVVKRAAHFYRLRHPQPEDVLLLIEVSDTTLEFDRAAKLPAYGRAGIGEVWIVNLGELAIEIYREPHYTGYGSKTVVRVGDEARPQAFPDVAVNVAELLKR